MDYKYTLGLVDQFTSPIKSITKSFGGFGAMADQSRQHIKGFKSALGNIAKFNTLKEKSAELTDALSKQADYVRELEAQYDSAEKPTRALTNRLERQRTKLAELTDKYDIHEQTIGGVLSQLREQGVDTRNLAKEQERLEQSLEGSTSKLRTQQKALKGWKQTIGGFGDLGKKFTVFSKWTAGITATTSALGGLALAGNQSMGADVREILETAKAFNVSTEALQTWRIAAKPVGVESEKIGDIFKDVSDKIGDYALTGAGEAKDLFETLKLKASEFKNLAPDQAILKIGTALEKSGLTKSQKIFLMEGLADEASRLLPLLEDNGAAIRKANREAKDLGLILTESQKEGFKKSQAGWAGIGKRITGIKTRAGTMFNDFLLNTGAFDWANDQLGRLNGYAKYAESWFQWKMDTGELTRWIDDLKISLETGTTAAWKAGQTIWSMGSKIYKAGDKVASFVGGWDKLLLGIAGFAVAGSVLGTIGAIASGLTVLAGAATLLASPFLLTIGAITAVVGAGWYLYNNWESVVERIKSWDWADVFRFGAVIPGIGLLVAGGKYLLENWQGIKDWFSDFTLLGDWSFIPDVDFSVFELGIAAGEEFRAWWNSWSWPGISTFSLSDWISDFQWPSLPLWAWPAIPVLSLLDYFTDWEWPSLPDWEWPSIADFKMPEISLPKMPDVKGWLGGWFGNDQPETPGVSSPALPQLPKITLPELPSFQWPAIPPLPELPSFPIPEPVKFVFDLNPINLVIGRTGEFKSHWDEVLTWSTIAFPGLSMTIQSAMATVPVDAFTKSGLSLTERWGVVKGWAEQNFPLLHKAVSMGLSVTPIGAFMNEGEEMKAGWNGIINWLSEKFSWLFDMIDRAKSAISDIPSLGNIGSGIVDTVSGWIGGDEKPKPAKPELPKTVNGLLGNTQVITDKIKAAEQSMNVRSQSEIKLKIDSPVPTKVQSMRAGKGTNLNVDTGRMMVAP